MMEVIFKNKKCTFVSALLASTLFYVLPDSTQGALVPVLVTTDSTTLPDGGQGYIFSNLLPANITLTITEGYSVGKSTIPLLGLDGSVDALTANIGLNDTLAFAGNATVTAAIGAQNAIGIVTLQGANKTVNFQGNITSPDMKFAADATANLSDTVIITGPLDNATGVNVKGTLLFQGGGQVTGNIGDTRSLKLITANVGGGISKTVELNGAVVDAASILLSDNGSGNAAQGTTLKLNNAAMVLTGAVTATTHNQDTLDIFNATKLIGDIGTAGQALNLIKVGQNNDLIIDGDIFATATQFQGNNTLTLTDAKKITGGVDTITPSIGILIFEGSGQVTGNIGNANSLSLITLNTGGNVEQIEFNGGIVKANTINIFGGGGNATTLYLNSAGTMDLTGNISTNNNNLDILNIANIGATKIAGNIGGSGKAFNLVKVGLNNLTSVSGNITATTTQFQGNNILSLADGNIITGAVDTLVNGTGTLQFQGGGRVTGNIGNAHPLGLLTLNSTGLLNKTVELDGAVINSNTINIVGNGGSATTLLLNGPAPTNLTANITTNNNNLDILNIATTGATIIGGNIGGVNHGFNLIKVGQNGNATINGNVVALLTQFQGNNSLTIGDGNTVTGEINTIASGMGTLQFAGSSTVTGDIGETSLATINLLGAAGKTVNFQGNVTANSFNFLEDSTATIADQKNLFAPVTTSTNGKGNLIFSGTSIISNPIGTAMLALNSIVMSGTAGKTIKLNNDIFANNTNVNNGGTLAISNKQTVGGNLSLTNASILSLTTRVDPLSVTGDFIMGPGTTFQLDMGNIVASGSVDVTGTATVDAASKINIFNPPVNIPGGTATITIVTDGGGGGVGLNVIPVTANSLLSAFSTQITGNLLQLVISTKGTATAIINCPSYGIVNTIDVLISADISGSLQDLINQLNTFTSASALCQGLGTLSPIVDGAVLYESFETQRQSFNLIDERAAKLHFCKKHPDHLACTRQQSGFASGDEYGADNGAWIKLFGQHADQSERQQISGYKNNMGGLALGIDTMLTEQAMIGAAFSWANLDIHNKISSSKTQANSYEEILYGHYDFNNPFYLNWTAALAYNSYSINRNVFFGNLLLTPSSLFHGWQTGAKAELGYDLMQNGLHTIPIISLYYSHLSLSAYTEKGINTANQEVDRAHFNMFMGSIGIKFVHDYCVGNVLYQPEVHMQTFYDFIGDRMETTSQFVGGGPSFQTVGFTPARGSFNFGGSVNAFTDLGFVFTGSIDWNAKEDYSAFGGYLKLRYEW